MKCFFKTILFIIITIVLVLGFRVGREVFYRQRYPLTYKQNIETYSKTYQLDPYFVASVIWVESKYNADAVSGKGAMGLMQIMPDTGGWIAEKLGRDDFISEDLLKPETNIEFGCWYLSYLFERFDENEQLVAAAYNSGPGRVDEWLDSEDYGLNGELVFIPYGETEDFC